MITHTTCEIVVSNWPTIWGSARTTIEASAKARPTDRRTDRSRQESRDLGLGNETAFELTWRAR